MNTLDAILNSPDAGAALGSHIPVRLMDVSRSGCLLEADRHVDEGATALLRVRFEGMEYVDEIRIVRCQTSAPDASVFRLGAQFLWISPPADGSLRRLIGSLDPRGQNRLALRMDLRPESAS